MPPTHVFGLLTRSLCALSFHKFHGFLFDGLDALWCAVLLFILQVTLEKELDLFHRDTQVDDTIKERPAGHRKMDTGRWTQCYICLMDNDQVTGVSVTTCADNAWQRTISSPDFLLRSMFDREVDENRPQISTFGVACQHFVKHDATFLCIAVTELQLSELGNHIHTYEEG